MSLHEKDIAESSTVVVGYLLAGIGGLWPKIALQAELPSN